VSLPPSFERNIERYFFFRQPSTGHFSCVELFRRTTYFQRPTLSIPGIRLNRFRWRDSCSEASEIGKNPVANFSEKLYSFLRNKRKTYVKYERKSWVSSIFVHDPAEGFRPYVFGSTFTSRVETYECVRNLENRRRGHPEPGARGTIEIRYVALWFVKNKNPTYDTAVCTFT